MHAGALRALEFDRIVAVVTGLAVTPTGQDRLARAASADRRRAGGRRAAGDDRGRAVPRRPSRLSPARAGGPRRRSSTRSASRDARSNRCGCSGSPTTSNRSSRAARRRRQGSAARFRSCARSSRPSRRSRARSPTSGARSSRPATSPTTPARRWPASASGCAGSARSCDDARVVPARARHREVPAGAGRHRSQRPLRADGARRAPLARFPASSTAARPAARACSSSRSGPSRSTTTSSRSRSRRPRRSAASCWR